MIFALPALAQTAPNAPSASTTTTTSAPPITATTTPPPLATTSTTVSINSPSSTVSGTVTVNNPQATNAPVQLTEDQKEKIKRMLQQQKLNEDQRKRAAELLDKTPALDKMKNPNVTESQSIPKRF